MISSLQNPKIKVAHALQTQAKTRRKEGKVVLEGVRLIRDALQQGYQPDFVLYTTRLANDALVSQLGDVALPVTDEVMRHASDAEQPQGILGVFPLPRPSLPPSPQRVLILDAIRDPGNLGTILRTGAAAGVQAVLLSPTCVDTYNPKVLRGGMGAHFRISLANLSWEKIAAYCADLTVYLADSDGDLRYDEANWSTGWALIIGSEAHGAGDEAAQLAQARVHIPMAAETESLNAAAAAAVLLFEAQRRYNSDKQQSG